MTAFLDTGEDESLTWEAKGGRIVAGHLRKAASAFGNSIHGGFLVLGITQDRISRRWTLDRWQPPTAEVRVWVDDCLDRGGVEPKPFTEVKQWAIEGGGTLACVAIWPVATPPVLTAAGEVFERTSGKTVPVADPADLRRLFERGEISRIRASERSRAADGEMRQQVQTDIAEPAFVLAQSATSLSDELSGRVFRQSLLASADNRVKSLHRRHLAQDLAPTVVANARWNQAGVTLYTSDGFARSESYAVRVRRDGAVAVAFVDMDATPMSMPERYRDLLLEMWSAASTTLRELAAVGETHVSLSVRTKLGVTTSACWSDVESSGGDELDGMIRDVRRALGVAAPEPEEAN